VKFFWEVFVTLFVIIDPAGTVPVFLGKAGEPSEAEVDRANVAFVPLGTPLLAGPGAIVAIMLFVQRVHGVGGGLALAGATAAVALTVWLALRFALAIHRLLRDNGVELVTRIAGLLLAAIAVQLVANSAIAFAHSALSSGLW
jgi:multiple antibiotic resistance protein